ncbi:Uncharacterised protein [Klebsiella pneumoniae]|nr:Uncharacterised protein [Klebsiella pneumoniae]
MSDLIIPILITLLIIGLVGIVLRLDKVFFEVVNKNWPPR